MSYEFCEGIPDACPPNAAVPSEADIFRGAPAQALADNDFVSFGELGSNRFDLTQCKAWGLSIWKTEEAVSFARANLTYVRKWHIHRATLSAQHGVIGETPTVPQPHHHTFWKDKNQSVTDLFVHFLEPEAA